MEILNLDICEDRHTIFSPCPLRKGRDRMPINRSLFCSAQSRRVHVMRTLTIRRDRHDKRRRLFGE